MKYMKLVSTADMASADNADLIGNEQPQAVKEDAAARADHVTVSLSEGGATGHIGGHTPVYYSTDGGVRVAHEPVVVADVDGQATIATPRETSVEPGRQVKQKDLRFLKIFAAVTIPLFPPTGIAAFVYALRTEKAFYVGVRKGDLTQAERLSSTCERLIIFSLIAGLLLYVLIVAIAERSLGHNIRPYGDQTFGQNVP